VKWNFAWWPHDHKAIIPANGREGPNLASDTDGLALRTAWLAAESFPDSEDELDPCTPPVTQAFVDICVRVAQRLHDSGVITGTFGRTIPIIVHELEYYDAIIEQTRAANPPGATAEFERWYNETPTLGLSDRAEAVEAIRSSALSEMTDSLATFLRPSARIFTLEWDGAEKVGGTRLTTSHFGGRPTLPENVAWPTWNKRAYLEEKIAILERVYVANQKKAGGPSEELRQKHEEQVAKKRSEMSDVESPLTFLGQISLREIQAIAPLSGWPNEGILAFFYAPENTWGNNPQDRGHCRILFFPEDAPRRKLDFPELLRKKERYPERALSARCEWTLEKYVQTQDKHAPLRNTKQYVELLAKLNADGLDADGPVHRLGGHAQEIKGRSRLQCQLVTNGLNCGLPSGYTDPRAVELGKGEMDWQLVMQFDSEIALEWKWANAGRVYFMARRQDIEAGDFSNCWAILQCDL